MSSLRCVVRDSEVGDGETRMVLAIDGVDGDLVFTLPCETSTVEGDVLAFNGGRLTSGKNGNVSINDYRWVRVYRDNSPIDTYENPC